MCFKSIPKMFWAVFWGHHCSALKKDTPKWLGIKNNATGAERQGAEEQNGRRMRGPEVVPAKGRDTNSTFTVRFVLLKDAFACVRVCVCLCFGPLCVRVNARKRNGRRRGKKRNSWSHPDDAFHAHLHCGTGKSCSSWGPGLEPMLTCQKVGVHGSISHANLLAKYPLFSGPCRLAGLFIRLSLRPLTLHMAPSWFVWQVAPAATRWLIATPTTRQPAHRLGAWQVVRRDCGSQCVDSGWEFAGQNGLVGSTDLSSCCTLSNRFA